MLTPVTSSGWGPDPAGDIRDMGIGADRTVGANLGRLNTDIQARSNELNGVGNQIISPIIDRVAVVVGALIRTTAPAITTKAKTYRRSARAEEIRILFSNKETALPPIPCNGRAPRRLS